MSQIEKWACDMCGAEMDDLPRWFEEGEVNLDLGERWISWTTNEDLCDPCINEVIEELRRAFR